MIYFIQAGTDGPVKIGFANEPKQRKQDLQVAHYEELRIIGVINGNMAKEKKLHHQFVKYQIRGEWFQPADEIFQYIKNNCREIVSNTVYKLDNGEYRIIYYRPQKGKVDDVLFYGSHNIRLVMDTESDMVLGIEGPTNSLQDFLRDKGVDQSAMQEYINAMKD